MLLLLCPFINNTIFPVVTYNQSNNIQYDEITIYYNDYAGGSAAGLPSGSGRVCGGMGALRRAGEN